MRVSLTAWRVWGAACAVWLVCAPAQASAPWLAHAAAGYARGLGDSADIARAQFRLGAEWRAGLPLSIGGELGLVRMTGERDARDVSTWGATLMPVVSWHFMRLGASSLTFDFGLGGALFSRPFPPGGTALNGYSMVGVGGRLAVRDDAVVMLAARLVHNSNGRGFADDNPAFDAIAFDIGFGFGP